MSGLGITASVRIPDVALRTRLRRGVGGARLLLMLLLLLGGVRCGNKMPALITASRLRTLSVRWLLLRLRRGTRLATALLLRLSSLVLCLRVGILRGRHRGARLRGVGNACPVVPLGSNLAVVAGV